MMARKVPVFGLGIGKWIVEVNNAIASCDHTIASNNAITVLVLAHSYQMPRHSISVIIFSGRFAYRNPKFIEISSASLLIQLYNVLPFKSLVIWQLSMAN